MYKEKLIEKLSEDLEGMELVHFQEAAELIEEEEGTSLLESLVALKDTIVEKCSTKKTVKEEDDMEDDEEEDEEEDDEDDMEDDDGKKKLSTAMKESIQYSIQEDVDALFSGETLSEEFKEKATTIFEAAITRKINDYIDSIEDPVNEYIVSSINEGVASTTTELVDEIDTYLDYVVEEWMEENRLALEPALRNEITEDFISGLKELFTENYIEIPEGKEDLVKSLEEEKISLEDEVESAVKKNINLMKEIKDLKKGIIISEVTKDMVSTEAEKIQALAEDVKFTDAESFTKKVVLLKESYGSNYSNYSPIDNDPLFDGIGILSEDVVKDKTMNEYAKAINNLIK